MTRAGASRSRSIRASPRLAPGASKRSLDTVTATRRPAVFDRKRHGGFYTQDDIREIVAYARERFVDVVPEIEMPGHSQAAIAAYPRLGNFGDTVKLWTIVGRQPLHPQSLRHDHRIHAGRAHRSDGALSRHVHPHRRRRSDQDRSGRRAPRAQDRMQRRSASSDRERAAELVHHARWMRFITSQGRRLIGWDEILEGGLAPNAVVMSWRGTAGGLAAARAGHDVVMTPGSHTYFDHYQSRNTELEPLAIGGFLPIDTVYSYEPVPAELEPQFVKHILGAQGQVWTEYIEGPKNVEYMAFPRVAALAEVLWTPRDRKNFADFSVRLTRHLDRLEALDVNFRRPDSPPHSVP